MAETDEKPKRNQRRSDDLIVTLTGVGPVLAIYLYFLGQSYLYSLCYYLGFASSSVDFSINETLVYSYGALVHHSKWNAILWLLLAAVFGLIIFADTRRRRIKIALLAILVLLFPVSGRAANSYAYQRAARVTWHPEKMVYFTFKDPSSVSGDLKAKADSGDGLIFVMQTTDTLVAMDRVATEADDSALNSLYVIKLDQLSSIRISFTGVRYQ